MKVYKKIDWSFLTLSVHESLLGAKRPLLITLSVHISDIRFGNYVAERQLLLGAFVYFDRRFQGDGKTKGRCVKLIKSDLREKKIHYKLSKLLKFFLLIL